MSDNMFEVIDFHTHPFDKKIHNICSHVDFCNMDVNKTVTDMNSIGISRICGSVISFGRKITCFDDVKEYNDEAVRLRDLYKGFYVPGFHVHPAYVEESCAEIDRMHKLGINLIGELVPYLQTWESLSYGSPEFSEILTYAEKYDMVVSVHTMNDEALDKMVEDHPNTRFVAAHPGEYPEFMRHMNRMKMSENYYLDVSGNGLFRHGMLRHGIDLYGAERFIFGSDYPICNPAMFLGGVRDDFTLTDREKELILAQNTKNLLGLK